MPEPSLEILERFRTRYGKEIDLTLRPAYRDLLGKLGNPHHHLPPILHVAGTNGKGSTCAFMRAMLEAEGYRVHVYTSPHLVTFHERIRIQGSLILEQELEEILFKCEELAIPGGVSYFEAATAAAFTAFARHKADFTILEVGLGGRLDATNVIDKPLASVITRLSFDHREYLGDTISAIAGEKAGIMRQGVPCFAACQPEALALQTLRDAARKIEAPLFLAGENWHVTEKRDGFVFEDDVSKLDLPRPALVGAHQFQNAGLAIAALSVLPEALSLSAIKKGLGTVEWPARLQRIEKGQRGGVLAALLPQGAELWLDGGHNDSAGEVLAAQIKAWREEDGQAPRPLFVILGMLTTKRPSEFLAPFQKYITSLRTVQIPHEPLGFTPDDLAGEVRASGVQDAKPAEIQEALRAWGVSSQSERSDKLPRILICGSLYLAGSILALPGN